MVSSAITILNVLYIIFSIVGIIVVSVFFLNIYWRKFVFQIDAINVYALSKREPGTIYRKTKRIFDLVASLILFVTVLPVILCISLSIKIIYRRQSVLMRRLRTGLNGKPFYELRFRAIDQYSGQRGMFGNFLRNTALDNLPQLLNIIKGELSLVGRSRGVEIILESNKQLEEPYDRLLLIKPGMTSLWAISTYKLEKSSDALTERLKYDLLYYRKMSFTFDMVLITLTFIVGLGSSSGKYLTKA